MSGIDLALLRSLTTVVDAGGFTSAQQRLHRTQSTISQQVKRLEHRLGRRLLLRSRNGVTPTAEGERVLKYARRLLALEAELAGEVGAVRPLRILRIGFTDDFAQLYLPRLLDRLHAALPEVQLRVTCDLSVHLRKGMAQGDFDLVFYKRTAPAGPGTRVEREPLHWVAARGYRRDRARPLPLLLFPKGCVYRQHALALLEARDLPWQAVFESPSTVSVQAATRAGLGVALLTPGSMPKGCAPVRDLPALGSVELVYEIGADAPAEAHVVLKNVLRLTGASG